MIVLDNCIMMMMMIVWKGQKDRKVVFGIVIGSSKSTCIRLYPFRLLRPLSEEVGILQYFKHWMYKQQSSGLSLIWHIIKTIIKFYREMRVICLHVVAISCFASPSWYLTPKCTSTWRLRWVNRNRLKCEDICSFSVLL